MAKNSNLPAKFIDNSFAQFCLQSLSPLINYPFIYEDREIIKSNGSGCNCSKSKCLKMYCECFAEGKYCIDCNCLNCFNTPNNEMTRNRAVAHIVKRNAQAFIESQKSEAGCVCKKTGCKKKYCRCHIGGKKCGSNCKCVDCKNN